MVDDTRLTEARRVLSQHDIDRMVAFLGDQAFRLSHREEGDPGRPLGWQDLRPDIERFARQWRELSRIWEALLLHPSEVLQSELREVPLGNRFRTDAAALRRNVREGRLRRGPGGRGWYPRTELLWGLVDARTLDTPENAHVVSVLEAYRDTRAALHAALRREEESLGQELERQRKYGGVSPRLQLLDRMMNRARREQAVLQALPEFAPAAGWPALRSAPNRHNNRTRFDERYRAAADLEDDLASLFRAGRQVDRQQHLTELGERRPWELYEYWMVAKVCELLERLQFTPDCPSGFLSLEDARGAAYGLRNGASLTYTHGTGLALQLTVQSDQTAGQRPDLQLDFVGGIDGQVRPLVLDAKCKDFRTAEHPELLHDLEHSARRYVAAKSGTAFLLHPSSLRAWPAQAPRRVPALDPARDLPFRHGIERLHPDDDRALRRILSAWFVRHGVFWVCLFCGGSHRAGVRVLRTVTRTRDYRPPDFTRRYPWQPPSGKLGWVCRQETCGVGTVLTRCVHCKCLIVKTFPTEAAIDRDNPDWLEHVEVYAQDEGGRAGLRHCAACGGTL